MELRSNVKVEGIPFTWDTNLSDDEISLLYNILLEDDAFIDFMQHRSLFSIFTKTIEFMDGAVQFSSVMDMAFTIYRDAIGWARWLEQAELQEEKETEKEVAIQLFMTEDEFLVKSAAKKIETMRFQEAAADLMRRVALREQHVNVKSDLQRRDLWYIEYDLGLSFSRFPETKYGLAYLKIHARSVYEFIRFCEWFHMHHVPDIEDLPNGLLRSPIPDKLHDQFIVAFQSATARFPDDGTVHKDFALFFERCGRFDTAIELCQIAIRNGLTDGTKRGFLARLKRLENKKKKWEEKEIISK